MTHVTSSNHHLIPQLAAFDPALIIFDKDGTLLDFRAMWAGWARELARRLEASAGLPLAGPFFRALGFDPDSGHIMPAGNLAVTPLAGLKRLTRDLLRHHGLTPTAVEAAMRSAWHLPDPVALARPLADLPALFGTLRAHGFKIAIATSDDRQPTEATLAGLELSSLVDALVCADDGLPLKPAPDMILRLCERLAVPPAQTVMVGDNAADLQMGRSAGVGLAIGLLSGVSTSADLAPYADLLLSSVGELIGAG